jgi:hypothetical protein
VLLKPTAGLGATNAQSNVCGTSRWHCVDDGTSLAASDGDATFVYATAPGGSHTVRYSGAPKGAVSRVATHVVAAAAGGAQGTVTVTLYGTGTLLATGAAHPLTSRYAEYVDAFDLSVADANTLQTKVVFSSASLKYTEIWLNVTYAASGADLGSGGDAGVDAAGPPAHSVALSWNPSSTAGITYNLYRSTTAGGPYTAVQTGLMSTTATDPSVASATIYYYVVRAQNAAGESASSNEIQAVIP